MPVKTFTVDDSSIISLTGCGFSDISGNKILPVPKMGASNRIGNYTGHGDSVIGWPNGYEVDGDLIISTGWGDGFTVRQLNDDGTITTLFGQNSPLSPFSTYNNTQNIALSKTSKRFAILSYATDGYAIYDYSNVKVDGSVTQVANGRFFIDTDGIQIDRSGHPYYSGMVCAGDWVYISDYSATHYKKFPRRNLATGVEEVLDGSALVTGNGYQHCLFYDEVNDRVYYFARINGNFAMIEDASTTTPTIVWCNVAALGWGDENYHNIFFIPDPINAPNVLYASTGSSLAKFDITPCVNGTSTTPTVLENRISDYDPVKGNYFSNYFRGGCKYQSTTGDATDRMLSNPSAWFPLTADRRQCEFDGWFDMDNYRFVAFYNTGRYLEDTSTFGRGRSINTYYSSPTFSMKSANGTRYYIKLGYAGSDGYRYNVWDDSLGLGLVGNWEAVFGPIAAEGANMVMVTADEFMIPSGCSISFFLSVDGGSTWEPYDYQNQEIKYFENAGDSIMFKITANGFENKAPYYSSNTPITIIFDSLTNANNPATTISNTKISRMKIGGAQ